MVIVAGRLASRSICWIASTAWPSEKPGARLNEIVTAGCWPWWLTCSGPTDGTELGHRRQRDRLPDGMPLPVTPTRAGRAPTPLRAGRWS